MLVVNRFVISGAGAAEFEEQAGAALEVLAACRGFVRGELCRAYDDPACWSLMTEWESVGAYRRALGGFDVKVHATPLLARSIDEPSAYEVLGSAEPGGKIIRTASDRAVSDDRPIDSRS